MKRSRIMFVERQAHNSVEPARIGRVKFSKTGRSIYYRGKTFKPLAAAGNHVNFYDAETLEPYWISGCRKRGEDRVLSGIIEIDADAREEYWTEVRHAPENVAQKVICGKAATCGKKQYLDLKAIRAVS